MFRVSAALNGRRAGFSWGLTSVLRTLGAFVRLQSVRSVSVRAATCAEGSAGNGSNCTGGGHNQFGPTDPRQAPRVRNYRTRIFLFVAINLLSQSSEMVLSLSLRPD
jgi:hypothetical protein